MIVLVTMMFIENFSITWTPNVNFLNDNSEAKLVIALMVGTDIDVYK